MSGFPIEFSKPKKRAPQKALRFEVELNLKGSKQDYTTVDFPELVKSVLSNKKESSKNASRFDEENDGEMVKTAAYFEEKYGRSKAFKYEINKGEGYIDDNSFIDDSEAYDEIIPADMQTKHGGFYINCGELELVQMPETLTEKEIELEKAATLQNLKRKRKGSDFDSSMPKIRKHKMVKTKSAPESESQTTSKEAEIDDEVQIISHKPASKERKEESILNVRKTGSADVKPKKEPNQPKAKLPTESPIATVQQSVPKQLNDEMAKRFAQMMGQSGSKPSFPSPKSETTSLMSNSLQQLQQNMLALKIPYDIVKQTPTTTPLLQANGLLPPEWNRFLVDIFQKTAANPTLRSKLFDYLSEYTSTSVKIERAKLMQYAQALSLNPVEVKHYQKASQPKAAAPSETSLLANTAKTPKNVGNSGASNSDNILNLSKSPASGNGSGFGEGLASKLQSQDNRSNKLQQATTPKAQNPTMETFLKQFASMTNGMDQQTTSHMMNQILGNLPTSTSSSVLQQRKSSASPNVASNSLLQQPTKVSASSSSGKTSTVPSPNINLSQASHLSMYQNLLSNPEFLQMFTSQQASVLNNTAALASLSSNTLTNSIIKSSYTNPLTVASARSSPSSQASARSQLQQQQQQQAASVATAAAQHAGMSLSPSVHYASPPSYNVNPKPK